MRHFLLIVTFLIFCGGITLVLDLPLRRRLPDLLLIQWLGVALLFGVGQLVIEFLFQPVQRYIIDVDRQSDPGWQRALRVLFLIALFTVPAAMLMLWQLY
ncbi:MAG: hypothetical protein EXR70_07595 [Deltaproteobacteria bacterium]|nr:hypothetical protein [Deltaproteobacteria bacterium]